jgi:hypothetical protein
MSLKLFEFTAKNTRTGESACFLGQGVTMDEAWKDAVKLLNDSFRPNSNGQTTTGKGQPNTTAVQLPNGRRVTRLLRDFEGDEPYKAPAEAISA